MADPARVVVGVDDRPAGLRALRAAAAQARLLGRELSAVRAFSASPDRNVMMAQAAATALGFVAAVGSSWAYADHERAALRAVERAFVDALGGSPRDVIVRPVAILGEPGPVLVKAAGKEEDLLVVGGSTRRRLAGFHRSVGRYCTSNARCPVLLVPPHDLARRVDGRRRPWRWRELDELLTGSTGT